jgi:hypothetical protein
MYVTHLPRSSVVGSALLEIVVEMHRTTSMAEGHHHHHLDCSEQIGATEGVEAPIARAGDGGVGGPLAGCYWGTLFGWSTRVSLFLPFLAAFLAASVNRRHGKAVGKIQKPIVGLCCDAFPAPRKTVWKESGLGRRCKQSTIMKQGQAKIRDWCNSPRNSREDQHLPCEEKDGIHPTALYEQIVRHRRVVLGGERCTMTM